MSARLLKLVQAAALATVLAGSLGSCAKSNDHDTFPFMLIGSWGDDFGTLYTITASTWSDQFGDIWHIASFDNGAQMVIAQNDVNGGFDSFKWSRFDWTQFQNDFWFCQGTFNALTYQAALAAPRPDDSDPSAANSCGTFTWSRLHRL